MLSIDSILRRSWSKVPLGKSARVLRPRRSKTGWLIAVFAIALLAFGVSSAQAIDFVGTVRPAALDQPQINILLRTTPTGSPIIGQQIDFLTAFLTGDPTAATTTISLPAYLDTGASGTLLSQTTSQGWNLTNSTFDNQTVVYGDVGVAGTDNFYVSQPLYVGMAPFNSTVNANLQGAPDYTSQNPSYFTQQQANPMGLQLGPIRNTNDTLFDNLAKDPNLADFAFLLQDLNVVGMPALKNKVMVVDARSTNVAARALSGASGITDIENYALTNLDSLSLSTYVYDPGTPFRSDASHIDTDPGIPTTNLHVKLSYGDFSRFTTLTPSGAVGPSLLHNPLVGPNPLRAIDPSLPPDNTPGVKISFGTDPSHQYSAEGSFLFDTGAGASFISENIAAKLHVRYRASTVGTDNPQLESFDPENPAAPGSLLPNQFQLSVGGIGGTATAAGFYLDSLLIRTQEGNPQVDLDPRHLQFKGAPVLVTDITLKDPVTNQTLTLDGDLGMNFLVASLELSTSADSFDFNIGNFSPSAFDWLTFDEQKGILGLALNSAFHIRGDFNLDGRLTNSDLQGMLEALKNIDGFATSHGLTDLDAFALADINQDGDINAADVQALMNALTHTSSSPESVPEPASAVLAGLALTALLLRRFQNRRRVAANVLAAGAV